MSRLDGITFLKTTRILSQRREIKPKRNIETRRNKLLLSNFDCKFGSIWTISKWLPWTLHNCKNIINLSPPAYKFCKIDAVLKAVHEDYRFDSNHYGKAMLNRVFLKIKIKRNEKLVYTAIEHQMTWTNMHISLSYIIRLRSKNITNKLSKEQGKKL